jgi:hypothetical protein
MGTQREEKDGRSAHGFFFVEGFAYRRIPSTLLLGSV